MDQPPSTPSPPPEPDDFDRWLKVTGFVVALLVDAFVVWILLPEATRGVIRHHLRAPARHLATRRAAELERSRLAFDLYRIQHASPEELGVGVTGLAGR